MPSRLFSGEILIIPDEDGAELTSGGWMRESNSISLPGYVQQPRPLDECGGQGETFLCTMEVKVGRIFRDPMSNMARKTVFLVKQTILTILGQALSSC